MDRLLRLIFIKRFYFFPVAFFALTLLALIILYPAGRSFFIINGIHTSFTDTFFTYFTNLGDGWTAIAATLLLLIFYRYSASICMLAGFAVTGGLNSLLKNYVFLESPRPRLFFWRNPMIHEVEGIAQKIEHSFPSGHANTAFFVFTFLVLLRWKSEIGIQVLCALCACVAAYSRVYLAHHFIGDILGGMVIGIAGAFCMYAVYRRLRTIKPLQKRLLGDTLG